MKAIIGKAQAVSLNPFKTGQCLPTEQLANTKYVIEQFFSESLTEVSSMVESFVNDFTEALTRRDKSSLDKLISELDDSYHNDLIDKYIDLELAGGFYFSKDENGKVSLVKSEGSSNGVKIKTDDKINDRDTLINYIYKIRRTELNKTWGIYTHFFSEGRITKTLETSKKVIEKANQKIKSIDQEQFKEFKNEIDEFNKMINQYKETYTSLLVAPTAKFKTILEKAWSNWESLFKGTSSLV